MDPQAGIAYDGETRTGADALPLTDLLVPLLADPFRIGLIIALVITMLRTRAQSGVVLPLAAGVVFVAVLIPLGGGPLAAVPMWQQIAWGIAANIILLALVLGGYWIYQRVKP